jgi:hypothetical protein
VKLGARWAKGVSDGITQNLSDVQSSADAVNAALEKGPRLQSYQQRLAQFRKATETVLRRLHAAVKANDPVAASYYAQQYQQIESSQAAFRSQSKTVWGDVASIIDANAGAAKGDVAQLARTVASQAARAQAAMEHSAERAGAAFPTEISASIEPTRTAGSAVAGAVTSTVGVLPARAAAWGDHAGSQFAGGLQSSVPETANAARDLAAAVHRFIAFSSPPRVGPLRTIRSWGPHLVSEWTRPIGRHLGEVQRIGDRLAAAITPRPLAPAWSGTGHRWSAVAGVGPSDRGDVVHIHVGTLIANDAGLDELERRMERRHRLRRRDRRLVGTPD